MSCAIAIEEMVPHAFVAGALSKVTVPVGIEFGWIGGDRGVWRDGNVIHAFVTDPSFVKDGRWIVMDSVPISLVGMTGVVSRHRTFYFFILALQNVTDHIIGPTIHTGNIQNHAFY